MRFGSGELNSGENTFFQTLKGIFLYSHWSDLVKIKSYLSFNACSLYLKVLKSIILKTNKKKREQPVLALSVYGVFLGIQWQITPYYVVRLGQNMNASDIMHVLNTYKSKMNLINSNQEKVAESIF